MTKMLLRGRSPVLRGGRDSPKTSLVKATLCGVLRAFYVGVAHTPTVADLGRLPTRGNLGSEDRGTCREVTFGLVTLMGSSLALWPSVAIALNQGGRIETTGHWAEDGQHWSNCLQTAEQIRTLEIAHGRASRPACCILSKNSWEGKSDVAAFLLDRVMVVYTIDNHGYDVLLPATVGDPCFLLIERNGLSGVERVLAGSGSALGAAAGPACGRQRRRRRTPSTRPRPTCTRQSLVTPRKNGPGLGSECGEKREREKILDGLLTA